LPFVALPLFLAKVVPSFFKACFSLPTKSKQKTFWLNVEKENLRFLILFLKKSSFIQAHQLLDLWALDFPTSMKRYQVNYCLVSPRFNLRFILGVRSNDPVFPSVVDIFNSANWLEREVWDMHGVFFFNHPDLRRILTDYGFEGYPLLKDFPLSGFTEIRYDQELKTCIQEPIAANQEYRRFDFLSPWVTKSK